MRKISVVIGIEGNEGEAISIDMHVVDEEVLLWETLAANGAKILAIHETETQTKSLWPPMSS